VTGFRQFVAALVRERPGRFVWVIAVQVVASLGQLAGVLLLIPLLAAVGVGTSSAIAHTARHVLAAVGLKPTLLTVLTIYVVVTAATSALGAYQTVLTTRYRLEFVDHLRARTYSALAAAEWRHLMSLRQSDLLAALMTNIGTVGAATSAVLQTLVAAIMVAAQLAGAIAISPAMTGLSVLSGLALVVIVWPLVNRSRLLGAELVQRNRRVFGLATGFLDALKLAKAYGREHQHVATINEAIASARASQVSFARASAVAGALQSTLTAALLGATVYVALRVVHVPVGSLLVVALVFTRVVSQIVASQKNIQQLAQALPAFEELMVLIAECERVREPGSAPEHRSRIARVAIGDGIRLEHVCFSYPRRSGDRDAEALRDVSLEIRAGATVALAGPSGAGKTTVADLVAGLIVPSSGRVLVNGNPLIGERRLGWRGSVALVPQDPFLFHDSIEANLRWARPEATDSELWDALVLANAAAFVESLASGLDTVVGDRGMRLSGGERQRLALARALLRDPDLLILDEATSSLDTENELAIRTALSSLRGQTTILLIAHRLSTVSEADEIVVLDSGRVAEAGSWDRLSHAPSGRLHSLIQAGSRQ
jgi:ATP-binding cassette subfamily C protein